MRSFSIYTIPVVVLLLSLPATAQTSRPTERPSKDQKSENTSSAPNPASSGFNAKGSDAQAIAVADAVMKKMGGRAAWDATRFIRWRFFGHRLHVWDRKTGDIRVESGDPASSEYRIILLNLKTGKGRGWLAGEEVKDDQKLAKMLRSGRKAWINDSYWMFMPYKLKDSGVTLKHLGKGKMATGGEAVVLELTFKDVGVTPQNKYRVYISTKTGLMEQWDFFSNAADEKPGFSSPWTNWRGYGRILLSDDRGPRRKHTSIAVFDELPRSVFTTPGPVKWPEKTGKK